MTAEEIHQTVMELSDSERARLAGELLASLPAILVEADEGLAEAQRRSEELDQDPSAGRTWQQIKEELGR